jgi:hypothetical protein
MAGRPTAFKEEMITKAEAYIKGGYKDEKHAIPSVVGLAIHLNVAKSTLYKWAEDKNHPFSDILDMSNDCQEFSLINGSLNNDLNPTISKLMLTKHGYSDKTDTTLSLHEVDLSSKSIEDLEYFKANGVFPPTTSS